MTRKLSVPALLALALSVVPTFAFADAALPSVWERGDGLVWALVIGVVIVAGAVLAIVLKKRKK